MSSTNFSEVLSRAQEENHNVVQRAPPHLGFPAQALFWCLHVGRYGPPGCQALEALVRVIDEDPVFVLVVRLGMVTCGHWQRHRSETVTALPHRQLGPRDTAP